MAIELKINTKNRAEQKWVRILTSNGHTTLLTLGGGAQKFRQPAIIAMQKHLRIGLVEPFGESKGSAVFLAMLIGMNRQHGIRKLNA